MDGLIESLKRGRSDSSLTKQLWIVNQRLKLVNQLAIPYETDDDHLAEMMAVAEALETEIENTKQLRYAAQDCIHPPVFKSSAYMRGVKSGTIDTISVLHMLYKSLVWLHSKIKDNPVFVSTGPKPQADSLDQLIVFLKYAACGGDHSDISMEFGCSQGVVSKYIKSSPCDRTCNTDKCEVA